MSTEEDVSGNTHWADTIRFEFCGEVLTLVQDPQSSVLGSTVWDSSKCFIKLMEKHRDSLFNASALQHKRKKEAINVLELGAGCGLAGIAMAKLGFHVVLTDVGDVLEWLEQNTALNFSEEERSTRIFTREYSWGTSYEAIQSILPKTPPFGKLLELNLWDEQALDVILCADVLYDAVAVKPLVQSILALSNRKSVIYIANERRSPSVREEFFKYLNAHFVWREIPKEDFDPSFDREDIEMFELRRKHSKIPKELVIVGTETPVHTMIRE